MTLWLKCGTKISLVSFSFGSNFICDHRGSVANMLVTSFQDSICRAGVETVLTEDGSSQHE